MNRMRESYSSGSLRTAFTLIEVVASLLLLGTLLVAMLVAHRRHTEQIRRTQLRLSAIEAADQLLTKWHNSGQWGPAAPSGHCEGTKNLLWKWQIESRQELQRVGAAVGRLEVRADGSSDDLPLVTIELLVPQVVSLNPTFAKTL